MPRAALLAVLLASYHPSLVGKWEAIADRPNCGVELGGARTTIEFRADGRFRTEVSIGDRHQSEEGTWSTSWWRGDLDLMQGGENGAPVIIDSAEYRVDGDELSVSLYRHARFVGWQRSVQNLPDEQRHTCAYRRVLLTP